MGSSSSSRSEPPNRMRASSSRRRSPPESALTGSARRSWASPSPAAIAAPPTRPGSRRVAVLLLEPCEARDVAIAVASSSAIRAFSMRRGEIHQAARRQDVVEPGRRRSPGADGGPGAGSRPRRGAPPPAGRRASPARTLSVLVLPAPLRPTTPILSPARRVNDEIPRPSGRPPRRRARDLERDHRTTSRRPGARSSRGRTGVGLIDGGTHRGLLVCAVDGGHTDRAPRAAPCRRRSPASARDRL